MKKKKLIFVDANVNHNKFYDMDELPNGNFKATWGRVGSAGQTMEYPMKKWDEIVRDKLRKGYHDVSVTDTIVRLGGGRDMSSLKPKIKKLLEDLNKYADKTVQLNYQEEALSVSETLVKLAQQYIDEINGKAAINANTAEINQLLIKLYRVIPRKMTKVKDYLLNNSLDTQQRVDEFQDKMVIEQGLLDVLVSKLDLHKTSPASSSTPNGTVLSVLDELGLEIEEITPAEETMLKNMMEDSSHAYVDAYKVINKRTQKAFDEEVAKSKDKTTKLLFHGSNAQNWLSILKSGLVLHAKAKASGLFNAGIYFAPKARKSMNYISGGMYSSNKNSTKDNWLAVFDVHLGKMLNNKQLGKIESSGSRVDLADYVPQNGYDSFYGQKGVDGRYTLQNDEYIVYKDNKCTIKYLIHINH